MQIYAVIKTAVDRLVQLGNVKSDPKVRLTYALDSATCQELTHGHFLTVYGHFNQQFYTQLPNTAYMDTLME